jgi:hypothetical protein
LKLGPDREGRRMWWREAAAREVVVVAMAGRRGEGWADCVCDRRLFVGKPRTALGPYRQRSFRNTSSKIIISAQKKVCYIKTQN